MRIGKYVLLFLFLGTFLASGFLLLDYLQESHANKEKYEKVQEIGFPEDDQKVEESMEESETEENESIFDYASLYKINSDCIGWIQIPGTNVDYPIMQAKDNRYYLNHDFNGRYAICGAIFMDCNNEPFYDQEHLILYGHQMKDGSMFKTLNHYKKKDFYTEHPDFTLYLKEQKYEYEIVSVYITSTDSSGAYYQYLHKNQRKEQMEYLNRMAAYSLSLRLRARRFSLRRRKS